MVRPLVLSVAALLALAVGVTTSCMEASASPRSSVPQVAAAARPQGEFPMFLMLNGQPEKLGVLTSTGGSVTNVDSGTPFAISTCTGAGQTFMFQCDTGQANVGAGSAGGATCDTTITGANHKKQIANAWEPYYLIAQSFQPDGGALAELCLDAPASTTINCAVFCMR